MQRESFPQTSWTLIARAGARSAEGQAALSALCSAYWFPVYAFIRRRGVTPDDAHDCTQSFFARLLERNDIAKADRAHGSKFRSWLLRCVNNHLANEYAHANAQRRKPPEGIQSLSTNDAEDRYAFEPSHELTPERLYDRQFALSLLSRVMDQLRAKYAEAGRMHIFEALKGCMYEELDYEQLTAVLGMNSVGAVRKAAFDLRKHYRNLLRAEVANTVDSTDEAVVDRELLHLFESISDG